MALRKGLDQMAAVSPRAPNEEREARSPRPVPARYETSCAECPERIHEGDMITKNGWDEWVHEGCAE